MRSGLFARAGLSLAAALVGLGGWGAAGAQEPAPGRPKVCLVLSGGGARGVAHVGVLKVLEQMRVPVDCIVGTSMGAIVGGAYAAGVSPQTMERKIRAANWDEVLSDAPARPHRSPYVKELERANIGGAEFGFGRKGLKLPAGVILGQQLELFLQSLIGAEVQLDSFEDLAIPYRAVATDITNGHMVVLEHGTLSSAMRASMAVPGVFAPQRLEGSLLVDGMLVRNLPVDVARQMGADVIIAVNLGSSLLKPEEVQSIFGVAEQTLQILTEQNVERSLAQLQPQDILIVPELGSFSSSGFAHAADTIAIGSAAAQRAAPQLQRLSLDEKAYAAWAAQSRQHLVAPKFAGVQLDPSELGFVSVTTVRALVDTRKVAPDQPQQLQRTIDELLATDDFERVRVRTTEADGTPQIALQPAAKSWGPDYYHLGLGLSTDFSGGSDFQLTVAQRLSWLTDSGIEWRNQLGLGYVTGLVSEVRLPLDTARRWFLAPWGRIEQRDADVFLDDDDIARYRERDGWLGIDLGRRLGALGEIRFGYEWGDLHGSRAVGVPIFPSVAEQIGALRLNLVLDNLDSWNFPRSGRFLSADFRLARTALGATASSEKLSIDLQQAFGDSLDSALVGVRYGSFGGNSTTFIDAFAVGGFLDLSGFRPDAFLVDDYVLARALYQREVHGSVGPLRALYVGGSLEGADLHEAFNTTSSPGYVWGSSLFIAADTAIGPFYFGFGVGKGGNRALYLFLGRP
jgi:NTE family protein